RSRFVGRRGGRSMAVTRGRTVSSSRKRRTNSGANGGNGVPPRPTGGRAPPADVYAAYRMPDHQVESSLSTGENAAALETYFGEGAYQELQELTRQAQSRGVRGGPRVLILPGIMGSKLGFRRSILDDVIWIDPVDFALGNLSSLALDGRPSKVEALGVLLLAYLKLKLT